MRVSGGRCHGGEPPAAAAARRGRIRLPGRGRAARAVRSPPAPARPGGVDASVRCGPPEVTSRGRPGRGAGRRRTRSAAAGSAASGTPSRSPGTWTPPRWTGCAPTGRFGSSTAAGRCGCSTAPRSPRSCQPGGCCDHPGLERGADGRPNGRLWRADAWLRCRLPRSGPPSLARVGAALLRHGITAVTDATPGPGRPRPSRRSPSAMSRGQLPQRRPVARRAARTRCCPATWDGRGPRPGPPGRTRSCWPTPGCRLRRAGRPDPGRPRRRAPGRGALRHPGGAGPADGGAAGRRAAARRPDRARRAGAARARCPSLARLGVRVVTQPGFLPHRGDDFLRDLPPGDRPDLYRCATLRRAGIPVALSSDAPYGPLDPWAVIAAATGRRTASGQVAGPEGTTDLRPGAGRLPGPARRPGRPAPPGPGRDRGQPGDLARAAGRRAAAAGARPGGADARRVPLLQIAGV